MQKLGAIYVRCYKLILFAKRHKEIFLKTHV